MERLFTVLTAIAVGMILTAGVGVYLTSKVIISQAREEASISTANTVAQGIAKRIQFSGDALEIMAKDSDVIAAITRGNKNVLAETAAKLEKYLPGAKKIRLIPVGLVEPDQTSIPNMSFGDIDMVKATFLDNPKPAIQGDIGPNRHLAITRKVLQNNQTIGVILASLDFDFLEQTLNEIGLEDSYMELRQDKLTLASVGEKNNNDEDFNHTAVPQTGWEIYFTDPNSNNSGQTALVFGFILLPMLLALGAFFIIYRQLSVLLSQDQDLILKAFKDILTNKPKGSYPVSLVGMDAVISTMVRFNRDVERKGVDAAAKENEDFELDGYFDELTDSINDMEQQIQDVDHEIQTPIIPSTPVLQAPPPKPIPTIEKPPEVIATPKAKSQSDSIFRAYDIRGIVGKTLTEQVVHDIGKAFGSEAKEQGCKTIVIGRDGRLSSPKLSQALANGIVSTGCNILDIGMIPTPVLYFVVQHTDGRTGVMITGSHNPAEYNGLKMVIKGETLASEKIQNLKQRIDSQNFVNTGQLGTIEQNSMFVNEYIGTVSDDIRVSRGLKVVIDCGNGIAGELAPALLKNLGCEVIEMYCEVDGNFPNHHPDPSKPENLTELIASVAKNNADIGIAFDGDGDRLGVIDSKGKIIWPDRQMMLFAKDVLAGKPGSEIIYDVKCSRHLADQIIKYGGRPLMWKTGHSFMKAKLKETGAKLAGEMSGHIFFNDRWFGFDDALYSAARLLQILSEDSRTSAEVFADFPDSINTPELNIELAEGENTTFIEGMFANAKFASGKITNIDGMRIDFSDGWGLVRASNTTPSLVIRFEADTQDALEKIQEQFRQLMLKIKPDIKLPF